MVKYLTVLCKYLSIRPVSNPIFAGYTQYHGSTYCKDELLCVSKDMRNLHFPVFNSVCLFEIYSAYRTCNAHFRCIGIYKLSLTV